MRLDLAGPGLGDPGALLGLADQLLRLGDRGRVPLRLVLLGLLPPLGKGQLELLQVGVPLLPGLGEDPVGLAALLLGLPGRLGAQLFGLLPHGGAQLLGLGLGLGA